jgi:hypothetical protein
MADAGVPVHALRKIAGHGSLLTTQRYLHPDKESVAAASLALSAHLASETGSVAPKWSQSGPKSCSRTSARARPRAAARTASKAASIRWLVARGGGGRNRPGPNIGMATSLSRRNRVHP